MAVLNKIRQRSLFLIIIIALALFSFVLADLFKNNNAFNSKSQHTVGTINGKDISREDFLQKVEVAQKQAGPSATNTQVMNSIWEQEVRQAIMETQFEKLGLTVEKDHMRDLLKNALATSPEFLNEAGIFDENKLNEYIANLKETSPATYKEWINYEKSLASNGLQQNYFNLVKAGLTGTLEEGKFEHKLLGNKVDIKFVQVPFSSIPDSTVTVSKSEISSYIKKHKDLYQVEASTDIQYVVFKEEATVEDENDIKKGLEALLNDYEIYNESTKSNETVTGFSKKEDNEAFVNANSDIKFDNRFVFKSALPSAVGDSLFNLNEGEIYGPYKDNGYFKVSKVVAVKKIPDSAKVRHILIPFVGATRAAADVTKTEEQAKQTADSILSIVKPDRSKFVSLLDLSSDKVSNEKEGVIEFAYTDSFAPEFKDFSFENKKGDLDVVKTSFGYHIIEILSQTEKKNAFQIATIAREIEPSQATIDKVFRDASNFEISADKKDFQELATENKYVVRPVNGIKVLDENIPGIGNQRQIVKWAFNEETEVSKIKRFNIPSGYAIVQLVAKHDEGLMNVEEASITVLPIIKKEKKAQIIRDRVKVTTLEDLAAAENTTVRTALAINMKNPTISGAGKEPFVVGVAFGLKEGQTSKLIDGNNGVYMVQVTKITPAVELDNYQAAANQVEQQKLGVVTTKLYNALKEAAEIEDNRVESQVE